jgi:hypothetical protein
MDPLAPTSPLPTTSPGSAPTHRARVWLAGRRRAIAVAVAVLALLALAVPVGLAVLGSGSGSVAGSAGSVGTAGGMVAPNAPDASGSSDAGSSEAGAGVQGRAEPSAPSAAAGSSGSTAVVGPKVARSAWLGMKVADLAAASGRARIVTTEAGGVVTFENVVTAADPTGRYGVPSGVGSNPATGSGTTLDSELYPPVGVDEARMSLNVPSEKLDGVLTELSRLGTVSYRSSQSQDVTDTYVDTKARVAAMQAGVDRLKALLAKTTEVQQVIALETELTNRQADLDSLTRRLAELDARTTTSDISLSMWTSDAAPVAEDEGFTSGLRDAWNGLLRSVTVILTGLAALLPWLVILGLVGLVVLRVRRRAPTPPSGSAAAGPPATTGSAGSSGSAGSGAS